MANTLEGEHDAGGLRLAIVVARFNPSITQRLLDGALETIASHGGDAESTAVAWVPGSLELAVVARRFAASGSYDAVICLGCVIRGQTSHYDAVVTGATQSITRVATETGVPIMFGVITAEDRDQAEARSDASRKCNLGADAARGAIEMARLMKKLP